MIDVLLSLIYIDQLTEVTQLKQDKFDRWKVYSKRFTPNWFVLKSDWRIDWSMKVAEISRFYCNAIKEWNGHFSTSRT